MVLLSNTYYILGFAVNGINNVNISSYERRYLLSSRNSGLVASFYDIAAGITVSFLFFTHLSFTLLSCVYSELPLHSFRRFCCCRCCLSDTLEEQVINLVFSELELLPLGWDVSSCRWLISRLLCTYRMAPRVWHVILKVSTI